MKLTFFIVALGSILLASFSLYAGQDGSGKTHLKVGDMAPDFTLIDQDRKPVTLSGFRGNKNVVLAFYILAFTGG